MSDEEDAEEEDLGEQAGEGGIEVEGEGATPDYEKIEELIPPKSLTYKEASSCLHMLGKDESGMRYAYLMISVPSRKLTEVSVLLQFVHVLFLNLGDNKLNLNALQLLSNMPYLVYLKANKNVIESADLKPFDLLQVLNFSGNNIISTENIKQPILECLDLNYNFVENVNFKSEDLPKLKLLEMRDNLLTDVSGIYPESLDSLYLAENHIELLDETTLQSLVNLRVLHLRNNYIRKLNGFSPNLVKLKYLNIRQNQINKLRQLRKLSILTALDTLIILQNPVMGAEPEQGGEGGGDDEEDDEAVEEEEEKLDKFRVSVLVMLPNLKRINKKPVSAHERLEAELQQIKRYGEIMDEESSAEFEISTAPTSEY